ncbi:MAG: trypsin-like serine peptidase, partial [Sphingomonadaceae bacterium]
MATAAELKEALERLLPPDALEGVRSGGSLLGGAGFESAGAKPLADRADSAARRLFAGEELAPEDAHAVEAIILPDLRPAITIRCGRYEPPPGLWTQAFADAANRARIEAAIPAVGRVELSGLPGVSFGGTGFLVGPGLLMTNRHVADLFATGLGERGLAFKPGMGAGVDLLREAGRAESMMLEVVRVAMIHPWWDMALLEVRGVPPGIRPLTLMAEAPGDLAGRVVAVIGYPAFDARNDAGVQNRVFGGVYDVKRLMPGLATGRADIRSYGKPVPALAHDSSTLGGASGSAVVDVATGHVVALHFAGIYLKSNYSVPAFELARDARVVERALAWSGTPRPDAAARQWWAGFEAREDAAAARSDGGGAQAPAGPGAPGATLAVQAVAGAATITVPLTVSIALGQPEAGAPAARVESVGPAHDHGHDHGETVHDCDAGDPDAPPEEAARELEATEAPRPWRAARAITALRLMLNARHPNRSKVSDGIVGDAAHASRASDHNPWIIDGPHGVVTAFDVTHDPASGCDAGALANALVASRDPRIKYIIWNRRICASYPVNGVPAWTWRPYGGRNPHKHHVHLSVKAEKALYDSEAPWRV